MANATALTTRQKQFLDGTKGLPSPFHNANSAIGLKLGTHLDNLRKDIASPEITLLNLSDGGELTISSGSITVTGSRHTVDTESDAASDDLTDISGGSEGDVLILSPANAARTVVVKHNQGSGTANIYAPGGQDIVLAETSDFVFLQHNGSVWSVLAAGTLAPNDAYAKAALKGELVKVSMTVSGGSGGATAGALDVDVQDLNGNNVTAAKEILILVSNTQGDTRALSANVTFGGATAGAIIASGNGYCYARTDTNRNFTCVPNNAVDETVWFCAKTTDAGVASAGAGCIVVEAVQKSATWSA